MFIWVLEQIIFTKTILFKQKVDTKIDNITDSEEKDRCKNIARIGNVSNSILDRKLCFYFQVFLTLLDYVGKH